MQIPHRTRRDPKKSNSLIMDKLVSLSDNETLLDGIAFPGDAVAELVGQSHVEARPSLQVVEGEEGLVVMRESSKLALQLC